MGGKAALVRGDHWAVRVGEDGIDCYEVQQEKKTLSIKSANERDTGFLDQRGGDGEDESDSGELCSNKETQTARPIRGTLTLSGVTSRTDEEIMDFTRDWNRRYQKYNLLSTNCQKFARDLVEFLVGGSYQPPCPLPQATVGSWQCNSGHFKAKSKHIGFKVSKWSSGKVGAIWGVFGVEAEGPKVAKGLFSKHHFGNLGPFAEASLLRLEAKCVPIRVRLEPNLKSGIGLKDGQLQVNMSKDFDLISCLKYCLLKVKIGGFGFNLGSNGTGISTPLGGIGLGKF